MIAVLCHVGEGADDGLQLVVVVVPLQQVQLSGAVRHTGPGKETSEWRAVEEKCDIDLSCSYAANRPLWQAVLRQHAGSLSATSAVYRYQWLFAFWTAEALVKRRKVLGEMTVPSGSKGAAA